MHQARAGSPSSSSTGSNELPQNSSSTPKPGVLHVGKNGVGTRIGPGGKTEIVRLKGFTTIDGKNWERQ